MEETASTEPTYWLLGAYWLDSDSPDQTDRFIRNGTWQNGYSDKYLEKVRDIKVGDRVAIKSTATQKQKLPFESHGKTVSKMPVKAAGVVTKNYGDGQNIDVDWDPTFTPKDWFFYTNQQTIWRLKTDEKYGLLDLSTRLIDFIWNDQPQDYDWFCKRWWGDEVKQDEDNTLDEVKTRIPYGIDDIIASGVFLTEEELQVGLDRLRAKKNLVLQGAPGVGKTFLARKLAYALMQEEDDHRLQMVQFHQTYSYEDFIRGYRPLESNAGSFGIRDAVFYKFCKKAIADPDHDYVFIIDEINRGNLSQIFGELLMLIEADKRGAKYAMPLVYQRESEENFYIPENVYLIGLMNLADRSLAIVDYALRRRFAFMTLSPKYESQMFKDWLTHRKMAKDLAELISTRMSIVNKQIREDTSLGENYQIGHSFFCPRGSDFADLNPSWFYGICETEIVPLLKEYWFDNTSRVNDIQSGLLAK